MHDKDQVGITFKAHFARAATQADGALRISFDLDQNDSQALVDIMKYQNHVFQVALIPEPNMDAYKDIDGGPW